MKTIWFFTAAAMLTLIMIFFLIEAAQAQSTAPTIETETYGVRSEKTGEMKSIKVIRRYPPAPPPQTNIYVLPPPVYHYGGYQEVSPVIRGRAMNIGEPVLVRTSRYEGPGRVVAFFKSWTGARTYVVAHKIEGGKGYLYTVYEERDLSPDLSRPERED